jgi:hypothetical protein
MFDSVLERVDLMLDTDSVDLAHELCEALLARPGGVERGGRHAPADASPLSDQRVRASVALCCADRMRGRWERARRHLDQISAAELAAATDLTVSNVALGCALVGARIGRVSSCDPAREGMAAGLMEVEADLRAAVAACPLNPEADYLLACLEMGRGDRAAAAGLFARAAESYAARPAEAQMRARCDLLSARLQLQAGGDEHPSAAAANGLMRAMRAGGQLSATELEDVLEGLLYRDAPQVVDLVSLIAEPNRLLTTK